MEGKQFHYFAGDHTAKGFYPLYESNFQGLDRLIRLTGTSGYMKSDLLQKIAALGEAKGHEMEIIHSSSDNNALDGVILPSLKLGMYNGDVYGGAGEEFNLDKALEQEVLQDQEDAILSLKEKMESEYLSAHASFATGLHIHDGLEEIYINQMDFSKADQTANELIDRFFGDTKALEKKSTVKHRYFGASTPEGVVDYIPNLTEELHKRYFIKGRAGTGKSTLLKKMASAAEELGLDVEVYHCGFDPESLDMIIVRELSFCIFDSTDPHEYFPETSRDEIIDLYLKTVTPGTDEKYATAIMELNRSYKSYMKEGIRTLQEANSLNKELETMYAEAMDQAKFAALFDSLKKELD
ncbi:hypothetical protein [Thalassobacillus pellis]|uniref:hypothetical protein n=1 Tax=Thalassobacillus pellis TaxID=748008 RepID=UPI00195FB9ED|nr:hypothetical protein [Thalassobacillus pellis]MBM7552120.1 hypothetical protein [Thalassobacillus pellis]